MNTPANNVSATSQIPASLERFAQSHSQLCSFTCKAKSVRNLFALIYIFCGMGYKYIQVLR